MLMFNTISLLSVQSHWMLMFSTISLDAHVQNIDEMMSKCCQNFIKNMFGIKKYALNLKYVQNKKYVQNL
jgi:hypothetical protein